MKYTFVSEYAHEHSIVLMCKLLNASRSSYSRAIVGWATSERIDARLVCTAFQRAFWQYRPGFVFFA
jgi:transposase InsO family protein